MKRTLVISDIHGCYEQFNQLLRHVKYNPSDDQLILLGDYVDRGMGCRDVVEQIMNLVHTDGAIALRGNHDQRFIDIAKGTDDSFTIAKFLDHGGKQTMMSYLGIQSMEEEEQAVYEKLDQFKHLMQNMYENHISFLDSLAYYYEDAAHIFVHAGLNPNYENWRDQPKREFMHIKEPFYKNKTAVDKVVVFGHTKTIDLQETADIWFGGDKIGIDGGCVFGLQLNCLEIKDGQKGLTYIVSSIAG